MSDRTQGTADISPLRLWTDLVSELMASATAFSPDSTPPEALRQMRSDWLETLAKFWESYSRSPQFLELMKQSFNAGVGIRKQVNDYLGEMHHQFQGVSRQDVDELMDTIQHLEQRFVDESERLGRRLDDLGKQVEQLRNGGATGPRNAEEPREPTPQGPEDEPGSLGPINP